MDKFLAEYYGTNSAVEATTEKDAEIELFAKMAADQGIDLNTLSDQQIEELYTATFSKTAQEEESKKEEEEEEEEKKAAASAELVEKQAQSEKLAEADFLGRVMAHAYVQELSKIAYERQDEETKEAAGLTEIGMKTRHHAAELGMKARHHAGELGMKARHHAGKALEAVGKGGRGVGRAVGDAFSGKKLREGLQAKKNNESGLGKTMAARAAMHAPKGHRDSMQSAIHQGAAAAAKNKIYRGAAETAAAYGGVAAAAGGAAAAAKGKKKESSAIDELAADMAVEKAAAAGWDAEEAAERMNALLVLGPSEENSKVATAQNTDQAIDIRSAELLEMAGYPVNWE